ncbi:PH-like domain-containing protein [Micrococcoides hystricis]|uniref:PH domain-containing protein n=1 Tax=Micrococcoides hystricis TaxID=1572761 RepID=A0ABV6P9M8_9MICC
MEYVPAILITIGIIVVIIAAMLWGWRAQQRRHANTPIPPPVPAGTELGQAALAVEGQYVSTAFAHDLLTRVNAHSLGNKSLAVLEVYPGGLCYRRAGEDDLFIPASAITEVGYGSGQSGKFVEKDGLIMVTWTLGKHEGAEQTHLVTTGFRVRYAEEKKPLRQALEELMASTPKEKNA